MRKFLVVIFSMLLFGCESVNRSSLTSPNLIVISDSVDLATGKIKDATVITKKVYRDGAKKNDPEVKKLEEYLVKALLDLSVANAQIKEKQAQIDAVTANSNKVIDRLNYLEPKYATSVGILWKWRFIAIGSWLAFAGYMVAKFYFRIPFL